ncbi:hypothetical protein [Ruixingdingia sedimenti]|uniref:Uncharacterized protein n=1 Tax=Ruixingdingia sedimenti TaxID=3073604 RepID=A0ABU1F652_9RHOB|nr:hypothetical protein [Xinfangfangia sp. LG-4]MDR5652093.1 hypothetical protein [Xinfangfangia sp. LG-4]
MTGKAVKPAPPPPVAEPEDPALETITRMMFEMAGLGAMLNTATPAPAPKAEDDDEARFDNMPV